MQACLWQRGLSLLSVPDGGHTLILIIISGLNLKHWLFLLKPCRVIQYFQNAPVDPTISSTDHWGILGTSGLQYSGPRLHGKLWHAQSFVSASIQYHGCKTTNAYITEEFTLAKNTSLNQT